MSETCAFVSPSGIRCQLKEITHRFNRGFHMAWRDGVPALKMHGDFMHERENAGSDD